MRERMPAERARLKVPSGDWSKTTCDRCDRTAKVRDLSRRRLAAMDMVKPCPEGLTGGPQTDSHLPSASACCLT